MVAITVPAAPTTNADELVPIVDEKFEVVATSKPTGGVIVMPSFK